MPALSRPKAQRDRLPLSPEVRLGLAFATSLAALIMNDSLALILLLAATSIYILLQVRLKVILIAYLFFSLMTGIALGCAWVLGFFFSAMKDSSTALVIMPFARLAISVNMILPLALYASLPGLAATLNRVWLPGVVKLPLLVTIRFIPSFLNDLVQLRQAVRLRFRGRGGFFFWLKRPLLWWRVFFMPLVVRLIRSADELAVAAELKGLSSETDFGRAGFELKSVDRATLAAWSAVICLGSLLQVTNAGG
jgi:ABC-type cobalt transport system, permease component CbiQ and related transporters